MSVLAQRIEEDLQTRAANDDDFNSGPKTRTKYAYDKVGNVTQRLDGNTAGLTENFYYDNLHRLDNSTLGGTANLDVGYDWNGNIASRSDVSGGASWTYDATRKHAVTSVGAGSAYVYDSNGNMTTRGGPQPATIGWTSYNYPKNIGAGSETVTLAYGPDRQYYQQVYTGPTGNETTHYIGGLLEKVEIGITTDWRHYIKAGGHMVAILSRSGGIDTVRYPLEDHQGSPSALIDATGTAIVRESFGAFGLPRDGVDWDGAVASGDQALIDGISHRGYTGHTMLASMGLIHMNGRVYDARIGRFLSPDPYVPDPGLTQSFNRYSYVQNNPLSFIDPSGFADTVLPEVVVRPMSPEEMMRLWELSQRCQSTHYYVPRCDRALQWLQVQQEMFWAEQERNSLLSRLPQSQTGFLANVQCHMHWGMNCAAVNAMTDEEALSARMAQEFSVPMMGIGSVFAGLRGVAGGAGAIDDLIAGSRQLSSSQSLLQLERSGGLNAAASNFDDLARQLGQTPRTIQGLGGPIRAIDLPDGGTASLRGFSSGGRPTIQVNRPEEVTVKIRY